MRIGGHNKNTPQLRKECAKKNSCLTVHINCVELITIMERLGEDVTNHTKYDNETKHAFK